MSVNQVEDEYTQEGLKVAVERNMSANRVKEVLEDLFVERGVPAYIRSDNGPEFIARVLTEWLGDLNVKPHHIEPGSPWQNAYEESFNATLTGMFGPRAVPQLDGCEGEGREMAAVVQWGPAAQCVCLGI